MITLHNIGKDVSLLKGTIDESKQDYYIVLRGGETVLTTLKELEAKRVYKRVVRELLALIRQELQTL